MRFVRLRRRDCEGSADDRALWVNAQGVTSVEPLTDAEGHSVVSVYSGDNWIVEGDPDEVVRRLIEASKLEDEAMSGHITVYVVEGKYNYGCQNELTWVDSVVLTEDEAQAACEKRKAQQDGAHFQYEAFDVALTPQAGEKAKP